MRGATNSISVVLGNDQTVIPVSASLTERSALFSAVMGAVRIHFGDYKVAEQLAVLMDCKVRSAARYLAGDRVPDGISTINLLFDPVLGPLIFDHLIERARALLAPSEFSRFENVMAKAALRAFVRGQGTP